MKDKLLRLIESLENNHDFESEFYLTYIGELHDGDYSDWADNHFEDNVDLGFRTGQTSLAEDVIYKLKEIIKGE